MTKRELSLYALYVSLVFIGGCMSKQQHKRILDEATAQHYANGVLAGEKKEKQACDEALTKTFNALRPLESPQPKKPTSTPARGKKKQKKATSSPSKPIQEGCK